MYLLYLFITISSDDSILEIEHELATINVDIVEISEVRRKGEGCCTLNSSGHNLYYIGGQHLPQGSRLRTTQENCRKCHQL